MSATSQDKSVDSFTHLTHPGAYGMVSEWQLELPLYMDRVSPLFWSKQSQKKTIRNILCIFKCSSLDSMI